MQSNTPAASHLSLSPLGAGDLIDRTVRLYRRHFLTLIRTAAPPVVASAIGSVLWTVSAHAIPATESGGRLVLYIGMAVGGWLLMMTGSFFFMLIMGGAARNLVMHLLWDEPVAARTIYRSVRARFWGLVGALLIIGIFASVIGGIIGLVWIFTVALGTAGAMAIGGGPGWFGGIIAALLFMGFTLGWYGYLQGVNPVSLTQTEWPVWYAIGYQVLTQASSILLAPVWMLGLSLLYVDERVRHEGYDIELMAAQRLGEMPLLPGGGLAPLAPAISKTPIAAAIRVAPRPEAQEESFTPTSTLTTLGLSERKPQ